MTTPVDTAPTSIVTPPPSSLRWRGLEAATAPDYALHRRGQLEQGNLTSAEELTMLVVSSTLSLQDSSTAHPQERVSLVEDIVDRIFEAVTDEDFEDGMHSSFSINLMAVVRKHGILAMQEISYLIIYRRANDEMSSEALRWLGRIDDGPTYGWRLWLLEKCLRSPSPQIRDGACLGLASLGAAHAIPYLKEALARERYVQLRANIKQVLEELEVAANATVLEKDTLF